MADTLTTNASDGDTGLASSLTWNGTTGFSDTPGQSSVFGGPIGGSPPAGQGVVGVGPVAGVGYLLVRRSTEFRLSEVLSNAVKWLSSLTSAGS